MTAEQELNYLEGERIRLKYELKHYPLMTKSKRDEKIRQLWHVRHTIEDLSRTLASS